MVYAEEQRQLEQCVGSRVGCVPDTRSAVRRAGRSDRRSGGRASSRSAVPRWLRDGISRPMLQTPTAASHAFWSVSGRP